MRIGALGSWRQHNSPQTADAPALPGKAVFTDRGRLVPSTQNNGFIGMSFMSVLRTATASDACALSVLCVRVAEERSVFCPKTGFRKLAYDLLLDLVKIHPRHFLAIFLPFSVKSCTSGGKDDLSSVGPL